MNKTNASRLGKILIEKGMITQAQLDISIAEQTKRRENLNSSSSLYLESTALGEVLIDLGFITRLQLKRCLNWQMILRNMTIVMSLCAPLMTFGSGAVAATSSSARYGYSYSIPSSAPASSSAASSTSSSNSKNSSSSTSQSSSIPPTASVPASSAYSVVGPVYLFWDTPNQRENGDYLDITDVGGYELRYRRIAETNFTYVTINDAWATRYYFRLPTGVYEFQVAVFDKNGLYSQFVTIAPR